MNNFKPNAPLSLHDTDVTKIKFIFLISLLFIVIDYVIFIPTLYSFPIKIVI